MLVSHATGVGGESQTQQQQQQHVDDKRVLHPEPLLFASPGLSLFHASENSNHRFLMEHQLQTPSLLQRFFTKGEITSCREEHLSDGGPEAHACSTVVLNLQEVDLWNKFNHVTNEMIVTKSGR